MVAFCSSSQPGGMRRDHLYHTKKKTKFAYIKERLCVDITDFGGFRQHKWPFQLLFLVIPLYFPIYGNISV